MIEKVKVSLELSEALNFACIGRTYNDVLHYHANILRKGNSSLTKEEEKLKQLEPIELAKILINGYELEKTPEEKLLFLFKELSDAEKFDRGIKEGILNTLYILDIKIKGIND